jgi:hypothetical protein
MSYRSQGPVPISAGCQTVSTMTVVERRNVLLQLHTKKEVEKADLQPTQSSFRACCLMVVGVG